MKKKTVVKSPRQEELWIKFGDSLSCFAIKHGFQPLIRTPWRGCFDTTLERRL